jgi:hypothetical protein
MAAPPTITAAITFSSRPPTIAPGTSANRMAFRTAATAVSSPVATNADTMTHVGSSPTTRADSR